MSWLLIHIKVELPIKDPNLEVGVRVGVKVGVEVGVGFGVGILLKIVDISLVWYQLNPRNYVNLQLSQIKCSEWLYHRILL